MYLCLYNKNEKKCNIFFILFGFMVHGLWVRRVHGSWFMVHGSWFMVHGSWFMVHGSWFMVHGSLSV
jgi:hypothetical protein